MIQSENSVASSVEAERLSNEARTDSKSDAPLTRAGSWGVHDRKHQLLMLRKRYLEADDYNRPAIKLLIKALIEPLS